MKKRKISSQENWKIFEYNNTAFIFLFSSLDDFKRSSFCNHVPFQPLPILLSIYIYIYKLTRSRAPHAHTSFSFDSSALASPHEQGRVRQSSCNLSLSSVPGHHPARLARVTPSLAPSPLFVQKTKEDLSKRREDNGADGLIDPAYIGPAVLSSLFKIGKPVQIEQRFSTRETRDLKTIEYTFSRVTGERRGRKEGRKKKEEERRKKKRMWCAHDSRWLPPRHTTWSLSLGYWVCGARVSPSYIALLRPAPSSLPTPRRSTRGPIPTS